MSMGLRSVFDESTILSYYNYGTGIFGSSKTNSTDSPLKSTSVFPTYN